MDLYRLLEAPPLHNQQLRYLYLYTLNSDFYKSKLNEVGIELIVPKKTDADFIHQTIFTELTLGIVSEQTKKRYIEIINSLSNQGVEGVIFGCAEISLLIKQNDIVVKIFDTTEIHAKAAADFSLRNYTSI